MYIYYKWFVNYYLITVHYYSDIQYILCYTELNKLEHMDQTIENTKKEVFDLAKKLEANIEKDTGKAKIAYITFDDFTKPRKNYTETPPTAEDKDTIGIVSYAMTQILRKDSPIKNVVLDLSQNLGGAAPAAGFVISAFLGDAYLSIKDALTDASGTYEYKADSNFDREFD